MRLLSIIFGMLICVAADATVLESKIEDIKANYATASSNANKAEIKRVAQTIKWSGITDQSVFDPIESDLLRDLNKVGAAVEINSWRVQMLAFSGLNKYKETISKVSSNSKITKKLRRHATKSLEVIGDFRSWNEIIIKDLDKANTDDELESMRINNMLESQNLFLVRTAASTIAQHHSNNDLMMGLVEKRLLEGYQKVSDNDPFEKQDMIAWLARALGESKSTKYLDTLRKVEKESSSKKVRRRAKKSIQQIYN